MNVLQQSQHEMEHATSDDNPRREAPAETSSTETSTAATPAPTLPAARDDDGADALPPPAVTGRGPMDQSVPDVATGSTPVTRRDD